jgi:DNA invertase Pin-like site-specific DNA recombinase
LRDEDVFVVSRLDRLSRSLKDMLLILEKITEAGAGFRSLSESIDTTTPAGRMMLQMLGAFAEFERLMESGHGWVSRLLGSGAESEDGNRS